MLGTRSDLAAPRGWGVCSMLSAAALRQEALPGLLPHQALPCTPQIPTQGGAQRETSPENPQGDC